MVHVAYAVLKLTAEKKIEANRKERKYASFWHKESNRLEETATGSLIREQSGKE